MADATDNHYVSFVEQIQRMDLATAATSSTCRPRASIERGVPRGLHRLLEHLPEPCATSASTKRRACASAAADRERAVASGADVVAFDLFANACWTGWRASWPPPDPWRRRDDCATPATSEPDGSACSEEGTVRGQRRGTRIAMSPEEVDTFLADQRTVEWRPSGGDGAPHVTPLWFVWDGATLWLTSMVRSQRTDLQGRRIAVVVDTGDDFMELRGVELRRAEPVGGVPRQVNRWPNWTRPNGSTPTSTRRADRPRRSPRLAARRARQDRELGLPEDDEGDPGSDPPGTHASPACYHRCYQPPP